MTDSATPIIDPAKYYLVQVARTVRVGRALTTVITPRHEATMRGDVLATIDAGDVKSFKEL